MAPGDLLRAIATEGLAAAFAGGLRLAGSATCSTRNDAGTTHRVVPFDLRSGRSLNRVKLAGEEPITAVHREPTTPDLFDDVGPLGGRDRASPRRHLGSVR